MTEPTAPVHLVAGSDPSLVSQAVSNLTRTLVGDGDRSLVVDELSGGDYEIGAVVDAAQTAPFLSERRVVVARNVARFAKADDVAPLLAYLADPLDTTSLVLVWEKGPDQAQLPRPPKRLVEAIATAGGVTVATDVPTGRAGRQWLSDQLAEAPIALDARATKRVSEHLGEDAGRLNGLIARLVAAHREGATLGPDDVEPFLGDAGGVPRWELTDAIEKGDAALALDKLHRLLDGSGLHPIQLLASLQGWAGRLLRLDGAGVAGERQAAELLGVRGSTFPAKKALDTSRRLGHDRTVRVIALLADADLALRGSQAWPEALVLEVLVARLARLVRSARG